MKTQELPPNPSRMIEGLRDTGYEFNTAVADIIDNSIAAKATLVEVHLLMDFEGEVTVLIADDGTGMNEDGLINAMRYGSDVRSDLSSLGKFGLGLKTASTAFCRCLSVITRSTPNVPLLKARWDLDHVAHVGRWELLFPEVSSIEGDIVEKVTRGGSGTLVVWEKVDRVLKKYIAPNGTFARKAFAKLVESLEAHVGMVYQRFLDPNDTRAEDVKIVINDKVIEAWDPFCKSEELTELVAEASPDVEWGNVTSSFDVKAYVLPRREDFTDEVLAKKARVSNDMQGFYIYRENRLIHYADWLGMFSKEPHGTLLRVEFSFDHTLDDAFHVDIKKSQILLNDTLYEWLKDQFIPAPRRAADERYRLGTKKQVSKSSKDAHDSSNANIKSKEPDIRIARIEVKDAKNNIVELENKHGTMQIKLPVTSAAKEGQVFVQPAGGIVNGLLWEPCVIDTHHAVRINTSHEYYERVYVPNLASGVTIQGMDSLLWALAEAELGTVSESTRRYFEELRFEVSKILRRLVDDLPEPELAPRD